MRKLDFLADQNAWHETGIDKERQLQILLAFTGAHKLSAIQTSDGSPFDALIIRYPNAIACAEIKFRNHNFGTFRTYTIDAHKLREIWKYADKHKLRSILIVSWRGDIRHALTSKDYPYEITKQRRLDRDERADDVMHIPLSEFVQLQEMR